MSMLQKLRAWLRPLGRGAPTSTTDRSISQTAASQPPTPVDVIELDAAYAAYQAGARFIDAREPAEWLEGHIAGAVHRPVGALEQQPEVAVARDKPVVTYCAAGPRAARAGAALAANGYRDVRALQSGYGDWAAAGYPVEQPEQEIGS